MYKYIVTASKVIAISTYAGKTVRGIAKCDPRDRFDVEIGKQLAKARCDAKVAAKRFARARQKSDEAHYQLYLAETHYDKMNNYYDDAEKAYDNALAELDKLESKL